MNPPTAFPYSGDLSPQERVEHYDEISAAGGALRFVRGKELMYLILNHLDRAKLHGIMDTPVNNPYWPENTNRFGSGPLIEKTNQYLYAVGRSQCPKDNINTIQV